MLATASLTIIGFLCTPSIFDRRIFSPSPKPSIGLVTRRDSCCHGWKAAEAWWTVQFVRGS